MITSKKRLAIVVSHPIQYYTPLYQRLAAREDLTIKVFFTWHSGEGAVLDKGFGVPIAWDIPLTEGYDFELVPNRARAPGTDHFFGLVNPTLVHRVKDWNPDAVHLTGWAWYSHLKALRSFSSTGLPTLFRGDSNLLMSNRSGMRWWIKKSALRRIFKWPTIFLTVGSANAAYYRTFGVLSERLALCPHSVDVQRFAEPHEVLEKQAAQWRRDLRIGDHEKTVLYAGKFERAKRPVELMRAVQGLNRHDVTLVLVGGGALDSEVRALAASQPERFRVLPFQNQTAMPLVYRLGDVVVIPSIESWGLAVNEALACGRPVVVSDGAGCSADVVNERFGRVFPHEDLESMTRSIAQIVSDRSELRDMGRAASLASWGFDISVTEAALVKALRGILSK